MRGEMSASVVGIVIALGAALLALWADVRFESRRPASPARRVGHALVAFVVLQVAIVASARLAAPGAVIGGRFVALYALLLPGLVYAFLSGLWIVRTLAAAARLARR